MARWRCAHQLDGTGFAVGPLLRADRQTHLTAAKFASQAAVVSRSHGKPVTACPAAAAAAAAHCAAHGPRASVPCRRGHGCGVLLPRLRRLRRARRGVAVRDRIAAVFSGAAVLGSSADPGSPSSCWAAMSQGRLPPSAGAQQGRTGRVAGLLRHLRCDCCRLRRLAHAGSRRRTFAVRRCSLARGRAGCHPRADVSARAAHRDRHRQTRGRTVDWRGRRATASRARTSASRPWRCPAHSRTLLQRSGQGGLTGRRRKPPDDEPGRERLETGLHGDSAPCRLGCAGRGRALVVLAAAKLGSTRLIDNAEAVGLDQAG